MEVEDWKKHHTAPEAAERLMVQDGGGCSGKGEGKHELKIWWESPKAANEAWSGTGTDRSSLKVNDASWLAKIIQEESVFSKGMERRIIVKEIMVL